MSQRKEEGGSDLRNPPPPPDPPMAWLLIMGFFNIRSLIDLKEFNLKKNYKIRMKYLMVFYQFNNTPNKFTNSLAHNLFRHFHSLHCTCSLLADTIPTHYEYQTIVCPHMYMLHSNRKSKVKYTLLKQYTMYNWIISQLLRKKLWRDWLKIIRQNMNVFNSYVHFI